MLISHVQANGPMVLEPCAHSQSTGRSQPYLSHMSHEKYCSPISQNLCQIIKLQFFLSLLPIRPIVAQ